MISKGKPWKEQIKPFNFCLVGFQTMEITGKAVKPLAPYCYGLQSIFYEPFIDYETEKIKQGSHYSKPLTGQYWTMLIILKLSLMERQDYWKGSIFRLIL